MRLIEPRMKSLGERGIDCIFISYAKQSNVYRFFVLERNDYVLINTHFLYIPTTKDMPTSSSGTNKEDEFIPNLNEFIDLQRRQKK